MELKSRKDIPTELTWDLSSIYPSETELRQDMDKLKDLSGRIVQNYKGKLTSSQSINACLDDLREMYRLLGLTSEYCSLAVSVDYYNTHNQELNEEVSRLAAQAASQISFVDNEIAAQDDAVLQAAISEQAARGQRQRRRAYRADNWCSSFKLKFFRFHNGQILSARRSAHWIHKRRSCAK